MSEILRFIDNNYLYMVTGITIVLCVLVFVFIQRYMYGAIRSTYQRAKLQLVNAMQTVVLRWIWRHWIEG